MCGVVVGGGERERFNYRSIFNFGLKLAQSLLKLTPQMNSFLPFHVKQSLR